MVFRFLRFSGYQFFFVSRRPPARANCSPIHFHQNYHPYVIRYIPTTIHFYFWKITTTTSPGIFILRFYFILLVLRYPPSSKGNLRSPGAFRAAREPGHRRGTEQSSPWLVEIFVSPHRSGRRVSGVSRPFPAAVLGPEALRFTL